MPEKEPKPDMSKPSAVIVSSWSVVPREAEALIVRLPPPASTVIAPWLVTLFATTTPLPACTVSVVNVEEVPLNETVDPDAPALSSTPPATRGSPSTVILPPVSMPTNRPPW